jgi:hypothetical protein
LLQAIASILESCDEQTELLRQLIVNSTRGGNGARNTPAPVSTTYSDFVVTHPSLFTEAGEPLEADHWLRVMESKFGLLRCTVMQKTLFVAQQLQGDASAWWVNYTTTRPADYQVSWAEFRDAFCVYYIPASVIRKKRQEFMDLKQGGRSVHDYSKQFHDRPLHQTTGAHGAQHWRDISRVRQQRYDCGRCHPRPQGNQEEEGCGCSIQ